MAEKEHVALTKCYLCGKDSDILIATRYNDKGEPLNDMKKYHGQITSKEPCVNCKKHMKKGVILISVKEPEDDKPVKDENFFRTGGFAVIKDSAEIFKFDEMKSCLKSRVAFLGDELWVNIGLPISEYQQTMIDSGELKINKDVK